MTVALDFQPCANEQAYLEPCTLGLGGRHILQRGEGEVLPQRDRAGHHRVSATVRDFTAIAISSQELVELVRPPCLRWLPYHPHHLGTIRLKAAVDMECRPTPNSRNSKVSPSATKAPRIETIALAEQLAEKEVYIWMAMRDTSPDSEGMELGVSLSAVLSRTNTCFVCIRAITSDHPVAYT